MKKLLFLVSIILLTFACTHEDNEVIINDTDTTITTGTHLKGMIFTPKTKGIITDTILVDIDENLKLTTIYTASTNKTSIFTYDGNDLLSVINNAGEYMTFTYTDDTTWINQMSYNDLDSIEIFKYRYVINNEMYRYIYNNDEIQKFSKDIFYDDSLVTYTYILRNGILEENKLSVQHLSFTTTKNPLYNILDYKVWMYLGEIIDFIPIRNTEYILSQIAIFDCYLGEIFTITNYTEVFNDLGILLQITYNGNTYEFLYN